MKSLFAYFFTPAGWLAVFLVALIWAALTDFESVWPVVFVVVVVLIQGAASLLIHKRR